MLSKCGSCGQMGLFEMVEANGPNKQQIRNTDRAYNFVQCAGCGAVVGVIEATSPVFLLKKILDHLKIR